MKTVAKAIAWTAAAIGIIFGGNAILGAGFSGVIMSEGSCVGTVTNVSEDDGLVFKTSSADVSLITCTTNGQVVPSVAKTFNFSVMDPQVLAILKETKESGVTVQLTYQDTLGHAIWERGNDHLITKVHAF